MSEKRKVVVRKDKEMAEELSADSVEIFYKQMSYKMGI